MAKKTSYQPVLAEPLWPTSGGIGNRSFIERSSPAALRVEWRVPFKDQITSPVVGGDGTIYVGGSDKHLYAFSESGTLAFKEKLIGPLWSDLAIGSSGIVYAAPLHRPPSGLAETMLCAVDPARPKKGRVVWSATFRGAVPGPLLPDREGGVVAVSSDGVVHAYDAAGRERFATKIGESSSAGATMLADGTIVAITQSAGTDGRNAFLVTGLNPDGSVRFASPIPKNAPRPTALAEGGFWLLGSDGARVRFDAAGNELASLPALEDPSQRTASMSLLPDDTLRVAEGRRGAGALLILDDAGQLTGRVERADGVTASPLVFADQAALISVYDGTLALVSAAAEVVWSISVAAPRPEFGHFTSIPLVPCLEHIVTRVDAASASPNAERQPCELVGLV